MGVAGFDERGSMMRVFRFLFQMRLVIILFAVVLTFTLIKPYFFSVRSFYAILMSISVLGLVSIGQSYCLLTRGFDLSVGGVVLISGTISAYLIRHYHVDPILALIVILILGLIIGFINGIFIIKLKINALIATLATWKILEGLALLINKGGFINVRDPSFRFLGTFRLFDTKLLQMPIIILIVAFIIFYIILRYTYYGKHVYAFGGNPTAAKFSGINVDRVGISVYVLSSFLAALSGYILASRMGSAQPNFGGNFPLITIGAAILGGVSLEGGRGNLAGAFIGVLIIQSLSIGLTATGLPTYSQSIAFGGVLLFAVFVDVFHRYIR